MSDFDVNLIQHFLLTCTEVYSEQDRLAENPSLYSDRFNWKIPSWCFTNKNRCIAIIFIIASKGFNITNETDLRNKVIRKCDDHPTDESWNKVLTLVKTEPFSPINVFKTYLEILGNEFDFYGNVIPMMKKLNKLFHAVEIDYEPRKRKVIPVKTCEYKDKGSRRPDHVSVKHLTGQEEKVDRTIEIPLRKNSVNFWSNVQGLEDSIRTVRELKLLQEEEELQIKRKIAKQRKEKRSSVKKLLIENQILLGAETTEEFYEDLKAINRIENIQLYLQRIEALTAEIQNAVVASATHRSVSQ